MDNNNSIMEAFLASIKAEGRSSPRDWHQFHQFLICKKLPGQTNPPVPLILAASSEANATKHRRLGEQLNWAMVNSCFDEALNYLKNIPANDWNACSVDDWYKDSYPNF